MVRNEALLQEVLKLPVEERADVAAELLASLESLPATEADAIEQDWGAEIERRARRVLAGESLGVPWEEVKRNVMNLRETPPAAPRGVPGRDLLRFAGTIDAESARAMEQAIEEGCERIDLEEW
jgi:putative addiction module component (TIGR02574 family)